jgi:hypothetical protein
MSMSLKSMVTGDPSGRRVVQVAPCPVFQISAREASSRARPWIGENRGS